jgi:hypothetical protein
LSDSSPSIQLPSCLGCFFCSDGIKWIRSVESLFTAVESSLCSDGVRPLETLVPQSWQAGSVLQTPPFSGDSVASIIPPACSIILTNMFMGSAKPSPANGIHGSNKTRGPKVDGSKTAVLAFQSNENEAEWTSSGDSIKREYRRFCEQAKCGEAAPRLGDMWKILG